MASDIEQFHADLMQDILHMSEAEGIYPSEAFFTIYTEEMMEAGELAEANPAQYDAQYGRRRMRVDGYGGDPITSGDSTLTLVIADFDQSEDMTTLTATRLEQLFRHLSWFAEKSLDRVFRESMEETSAAFGLADTIATRWDIVAKIRLFVLSNRVLSSRVMDRTDGSEIEGKSASHSVWDLTRMHQYRKSLATREEMTIDLESDFGGAISALPAHLPNADYESYMAVLPAEQLAQIYARWGDRLLEQNVRVFLQSRSNVNKGLRNTLQNEPNMFFAYNNGITATAEHIETRQGDNGVEITQLRNFQIVNGGQTTGSIYNASLGKKDAADLSDVFVPMKLSIIDPERIDDVVPLISKYANSQNSVNAADFSANTPFHVRMEEFSRRIYAPPPAGSMTQSKWFYERARGQYQQSRASLTNAERRKHDIEYPRSQRFTKTDLAKYMNVWLDKPHIVSRGAQKNFADFATDIDRKWDQDQKQFNELYYREAIAKAIIFKGTEKLVSNQPWYEPGGYRAAIVAYSIAKLAHHVRSMKKTVDFEKVWQAQELIPDLAAALDVSSTAVKEIIENPVGSGSRNITEWAKQEACWTQVSKLNIAWPERLTKSLVSGAEKKKRQQAAKKDQKLLNGFEAVEAVLKAPPDFWADLEAWNSERGLLTPMELNIMKLVQNRNVPSDKQAEVLVRAIKRLNEEGFPRTLAD